MQKFLNTNFIRNRLSLCLAIFIGWTGIAYAAGDTIIYSRPADSEGLDSHKVTTTISFQVMQQIYSTLLTLDDKGKVYPGLAESYSVSEDGLTYRFKIRSGNVCHDGTKLDAAAVKWNFDRVSNPDTGSPFASSYGDIAETKVEGSDVVLQLNAPFSPLPSFLGGVLSIMMCPSSVNGEDFNPVGTGPWKFVSWDRNNKIVLERNEDYINYHPLVTNPGPPHMKNLIIKVIPEGIARMAALRTGEVDFAEPSIPDAAELALDPNFKVYTSPLSGQQGYLGSTYRIPPFDDIRARRAVGYAIDRNACANIAFEELSEATHCPIAPGLPGEDQALCSQWGTSYDPDKAKSLLAELGYNANNPLKINFEASQLQGWDECNTIIQQQLKESHIDAKLNIHQWAGWTEAMTAANSRTSGTPAIWSVGMSGTDGDYLVFLWGLPGAQGAGIDVPEFQQMLVDQRALTGDARIAKLHEVQKFLLEGGYEIPLFSPGWFWLSASSAKVNGFFQIQVAMPVFNDVTLGD